MKMNNTILSMKKAGRRWYIFFLLITFSSVCFAQKTDHKKVAVQVLDWLNKKEFAQIFALFDSTVASQFSAAQLEQAWNGLLAQTGGFKKADPPVFSFNPSIPMIDQRIGFQNAAFILRIGFTPADKISTLLFLSPPATIPYVDPAYVKKDKFEEREVTVKSGTFELPGTFTVPRDTKGFPIVILVHGSGPNDRDETVGGAKVFRDLANGLATNGVGVLRYDKRTYVYGARSSDHPDSITVKEEVLDDAAAAVKLAKTLPGVDTSRIFLLGHSLGAMLMPRMASQISGLAGVIMMAGNARPLEDLYLDQVLYLLQLDGDFSKEDRERVGEVKTQALRVKNLGRGNPFPPASELPLNLNAKYWYDLQKYDQVETAKQLKLPVFIMQGERDYQVTMDEFNRWQKAMYYNKNVKYKTYPKLNHAFTEGEGKSTPQEYDKQANVPEYVISDIVKFITAK
jgi:uncharacterized protein